jgi:N-acetylglucosaminyldiphosphoundecaprenol N-acetyl-beta-D-mannosaminyltransferase
MKTSMLAIPRVRKKVLGYPVDIVDKESALALIEAAWRQEKGMHVVTLNAEMVTQAQSNSELDRIIRRAHLIVPDGAGVVFALRLSNCPIERLPGVELSEIALAQAAKLKKKVALIGGRPEVLAKLQMVLESRYPGLDIVASHDGYFSKDDEQAVVDALASAKPDLLLVALGVPKQEYFIDSWLSEKFPKTVMIGVGGSFDIWAGFAKRAPEAMRNLHLEWLYRLIIEPWRFQRMATSLPQFAIQVVFDRLFGKQAKTVTNGQDKPGS